jgi:hypothetical protein
MEDSKIVTRELKKMRQHVVVVGAIHIGFGIIGLIASAAIFFGLSLADGFIPYNEMPEGVAEFLKVLFVSLPLLIGALSTMGLVGGIGLLGFQLWARYLVIVVAIIGLLNIPIGTLKGVYSLWVLFQNETVALFEHK